MRKERRYHYIYKTTCIITGKYYIGMHSTDNLDDGYLGSGKRLWFSINYHGKENHTKEILEFLDSRKLLKEREAEIVTNELIQDDFCMNLVTGGQGGGFVDDNHFKKFQLSGSKAGNKAFLAKLENDVEFRERISIETRETTKQLIKEGKLKIPKCDWTGRQHSEETKFKLSKIKKETSIGEANSQYGTCWITKDNLNKKISLDEINIYELDGWVKGRITNIKGESILTAKLKESDVILIKQMLLKGDKSHKKISEQFNVKRETISKISRGQTWSHIKI